MSRVGWLMPLAAGFRLQLALTRRTPAQLLVIVTAPLFSAIFLSLALHYGSSHIVDVVIGPGLIGVWVISLDVAGSVLSDDRWGGQLELFLGTSASLSLVVLGRILAVSGAGMLTFGESWLVARLGFGVTVPLEHPGLLLLALALIAFGSACTATLLAAAFVLSRNLHVFQNSLSYPIYILGGIVVPVATLPGWIHPISTVIYLSWGADLLRDAAGSAHSHQQAADIGMTLGLALLALGIGIVLTQRFQQRLRLTAAAGYG
jgi:ABC-2 type transport system permease protein